MSEYVPDPWPFILLALAAFRVWKLIADDRILDRPRDRILARLAKSKKQGRGVYWSDFLLCPHCAGFWLCVAWWGAWLAYPAETLVVAVPWALSAIVGWLGMLYFTISDLGDD
jgi:hypothetical protein